MKSECLERHRLCTVSRLAFVKMAIEISSHMGLGALWGISPTNFTFEHPMLRCNVKLGPLPASKNLLKVLNGQATMVGPRLRGWCKIRCPSEERCQGEESDVRSVCAGDSEDQDPCSVSDPRSWLLGVLPRIACDPSTSLGSGRLWGLFKSW